MSDVDANTVALTVFGQEITLGEALHTLKVHDRLVRALRPVIDDAILNRAVEEMGITIEDEAIQAIADTVRRGLKLHKAEQTMAWLEQNGLTVEDFENRIRRTHIVNVVKEKLAEDKVESYFAEHRAEYDRAVISHVVVEDVGMAHELLSQVEEDEAEIADLARKHSIDERTKEKGGSLGKVVRNDLSPAIQKAVFNAAVDDVVGPLKTDQGYHLIHVRKLDIGTLDDELRDEIIDRIYDEWLDEQYVASKANVKLLDVV